MKRRNIIVLALAAALLTTSCSSDLVAQFASDTFDNWVENGGIENLIDNVEKVSEEITPSMAYYVGRSVASSILGTYKLYDDFDSTEYVNLICSALAFNSSDPYGYKGYWVAILDTDEITAMATPGGHIFVSKGLIKCTDSEDALAGVIAHELSHVQLKHSIKAIKTSRTAQMVSSTVSDINKAAATTMAEQVNVKVSQEQLDSFASFGSEITDTLVNSGFSRAQEFDADRSALEFMLSSGYDPNAMIDMLEMIKAQEDNSTSEKKGWQKTHPAAKDRIDSVNKELKKMKIDSSAYTDRSVRQARFDSFKKNIK